MEHSYDLIVIGAGPGGYVAAIKAAKLGLKTAIVEERKVGGTCLNRGCIPAKAMLHASSLYREMKASERFGIFASDVRFDYEKIVRYKEETTERLVQGVEQLLRANGVEVIEGKGTLLPDRKVRIRMGEEESVYCAGKVILATGSRPLRIPVPGIELPGVLTSDELFELRELPESLAIIGGGVIGVELATVFASLGCKVAILEAMPGLVPNLDKEISQNLKLILKKRGVDIHTAAAVQKIEENRDGYACRYIEKEEEKTVASQYILCAVGRCPNTDGLFADGLELQTENGRVIVDEHFESSEPGVYAIGDLISGAQLAHVASAQAIVLAEHLAGKEPSVALDTVPSCVYTDPEIASVGMTESEAKKRGIPVSTGKFIMSSNGKSLLSKEERGFIKVIARESDQVVLGAQMMCARATDMIGELTTAVANGLTVPCMLKGMRAHPTYNEAVGEAFEELEGGAIHIVPQRRR